MEELTEMYSSTFYEGSGIVLSTDQNDLKAGKRVFFLFVLSFSEENVSYFNNNMCYDSHTLHVGDAANCVVVKNGGKTRTLAFLPCSQTSLVMEFLLPVVLRASLPVTRVSFSPLSAYLHPPASESGLQLKLVSTTLKILLLKLKALITKKTSAKSLRFENVVF